MIKNFEINETTLNSLAKKLLANNLFTMQEESGFMDKAFANTYIVLKAKNNIKIKYITDNMNQSIYCQIEDLNVKYEFEDFCQVFNIPLKEEKEDFLKMIETYSNTIYENIDKIFKLLDNKHKDETFRKMSQFYTYRQLNK